MTGRDAVIGVLLLLWGSERALRVDGAGLRGPPLHPLRGQRVGADRQRDLAAQQDQRQVVGQEERCPGIRVRARPRDAHLDHHVEQAPGRGVPPPEQRGSRRVVREEQPAQVGREWRAGREAPGEGLRERAPRGPAHEQLRELVGREGLEDRVERPRGERVDLGAQAVLAAEVVDHERGGDAGLGGDLAHGHRVGAAVGEEPQCRVADGRPGGQVTGADD
jgi:hypothetical protein